MVSVSPSETTNRWRKAQRVADVLESHGAVSSTIERLPDDAWTVAERLAGVTVPCSPETRHTVADILEEREALHLQKHGCG